MTRYLALVRNPCSEPVAETFVGLAPSIATGQMLVPDFTTMPVGNVAENPKAPLASAVTFAPNIEVFELAVVPTINSTKTIPPAVFPFPKTVRSVMTRTSPAGMLNGTWVPSPLTRVLKRSVLRPSEVQSPKAPTATNWLGFDGANAAVVGVLARLSKTRATDST